MPGIEWVNTLDNSGFIRSMNEMNSQIRQSKVVLDALGVDTTTALEKMDAAGRSFNNTLKQMGALAGVGFSVGQISSFANKVMETRAYFQDIESSMKVFLGNEEKAADFTKKLKDYAYYNMFDFADLANASKQMIAYQHNIDTIIPRLDQLSNVARGTNAPLMEMVNAYNKAKNLGGLDGRDLQAWAAKGLIVKDILKEMGEETNGTRVSFEQFNKVLDHVTGEGGMFHGLMLEQMDNISAEQGQLEDTLDNMYNAIGEKYEDAIVKWYKMRSAMAESVTENPISSGLLDIGADASNWMLDHYQAIAKVLISCVVAFGEYRAALMLTRAVEKGRQKFDYDVELKALNDEIKALDALLPKKEADKNADLAAAVAKKKYTEEQAKVIAAKRAELEQMKVDRATAGTDQEIIRLRTLKLDEDLQEVVSTKKLTLSQAEEVQSRRAVLAQLQQEIKKRKELELAKISEAGAEVKGKIQGIDADISSNKKEIKKADEDMASYEKQIAKLDEIGASEEEINEVIDKHNEALEHQRMLIEENKKLEEERAKLQGNLKDLGAEKDEVSFKYGSDEEQLQILAKRKDDAQGLLRLRDEELEKGQEALNNATKEEESAKKKLADLQKQLEDVKKINAEKKDNGEEEDDTSGIESGIADAAAQAAEAAKKREAAAIEVTTLKKKKEDAQNKLNAISEQQQIISSRGVATAKGVETAAVAKATIGQRMHAAAVSATTAVTKFFSTAVKQAVVALKGMGAAMAANPLGAILTGLTLVLPWIMDFTSSSDDAADAEGRYGNAANEAADKVNTLLAVIESTNESSKARADAVKELAGIYDQYGIEIEKVKDANDKETISVNDLKEKKNELVAILREEAIERQRLKDIEKIDEGFSEEEKKARNAVMDSLGSDFTDAEKNQMFNVLPEGALEQVTAAWEAYMEKQRQYINDPAALAQEFAKFNAVLASSTENVAKYAEALGKGDGATKKAVGNMQLYYRNLAMQRAEDEKAKRAAEAAARSAGGVASGKTDYSKPKEEIKSIEDQIFDLYEELDELDKKEATPKVKTDDAPKAKEDVEDTKGKVDELDGAKAEPKVDTKDLEKAVTDAQEAIDGVEGLSSTDGSVFIDNSDLDETIQGASDAINGVIDLDLTSANPKVDKEHIDSAIDRVNTAITSMKSLDIAKAYPNVDLTGYNNIITKLLNIKKLLSSIAGTKVDEGEVKVNGEGKGSGKGFDPFSFVTDKLKQVHDVLNSPEAKKAKRQAAKKQLAERKKKNEEWFADDYTDSEIDEQISTWQQARSKFKTNSEGYGYYTGLIERAQQKKGSAIWGKKRGGGRGKSGSNVDREEEDKAKRREKQFELQQKQEEEKRKQEQETRAAVEKERISAIDNEGERRRAEEDEQHRLNMQAIDNRVLDMKKKHLEELRSEWELNNKDKKAVWADTKDAKENTVENGYANIKLTEDEQKQIDAERKTEENRNNKIIEERVRTEKEAMTAYLKEYGTMQQKRLAIAQEYDEKIRKAQTDGARLQAIAEKEIALKTFDKANADKLIDWEGIFGNLTLYTTQELEHFKNILREKLSDNTTDVEGYKTIVEQINSINEAIVGNEEKQNTFLGMYIRRGTERLKLERELNEAKEQQTQAEKDAAEKQATYESTQAGAQTLFGMYGYKGDASNQEGVLSYFRDKFGADTKEYDIASQALNKLQESALDVENAQEKQTEATRRVTTAERQLDNFLGDFAKVLNDAMPTIQQVVDNISSLPDLLGNLGVDADSKVGQAASGLADTANSAMGAMQDYMSGNYIGAASKALDALGSFGDTLGAIGIGGFGSSDADLHKDIERLTQSNQNLQKAIDAMSSELQDADIFESVDIYKQQMEYLRQNTKNTQEMMRRAGAAYSNGFMGIKGQGSSNKKINQGMTSAEWQQISKIAGRSVSSATQFWSLTQEQMYKVMTYANGAWTHLQDLANDGMEDASQWMEEYANGYKQAEELQQQLNEKLTSVSFDSVFDSFKSMVSDMDSTAFDFSKNFEQYMYNAMLNAQLDDTFKERMKGWHQMFSNYMANDGSIDSREMEILRTDYMNMVDEAKRIRDNVAEITGYSTSSQQSTTYTASQSFTQEQGDVLNGRLTAIQIGVQQQGALAQQIQASLAAMNAIVTGNGGTMTEMRNILLIQNNYLDDIARQTKSIYEEFGQKIDRLVTNTNNL